LGTTYLAGIPRRRKPKESVGSIKEGLTAGKEKLRRCAEPSVSTIDRVSVQNPMLAELYAPIIHAYIE
jgi:hypothetical protein